MDKILIILQGPPCSGKSTWAKEYQQNNGAIIVNRDTIRYNLGNGKYTMDHESEVSNIEESQVEEAMLIGSLIILDSTNLNPKYLVKWNDLAKKYNYEIEYKKFYIPFQEAMKRSKARKEAGGLYISQQVMMHFYQKYYPEKYKQEFTTKVNILPQNIKLPKAVIFDLDGTIAYHQGRHPYEYNKIPTDIVDTRTVDLVKSYIDAGIQVIFLTGRPKSTFVESDTIKWLQINYPFYEYNEIGEKVYYWKLIMRESNDNRKSAIVKKELFSNNIQFNYYVLAVYEDSNTCVEMWRELGLYTCQVANNDY